MPDREKVIKGLELCDENNFGSQCPLCYCYPLHKSDKCIFKLHEDALAMLKAQEAKPPVVKENSYGWKFYYCPSCGKEFYQNNKFSFCENCGQAVKWE